MSWCYPPSDRSISQCKYKLYNRELNAPSHIYIWWSEGRTASHLTYCWVNKADIPLKPNNPCFYLLSSNERKLSKWGGNMMSSIQLDNKYANWHQKAITILYRNVNSDIFIYFCQQKHGNNGWSAANFQPRSHHINESEGFIHSSMIYLN